MGRKVYPVGFIGSDSVGGKLLDFFSAVRRISIPEGSYATPGKQ